MNHVKKLEFPKGTPEAFIKEVASKISSWHIVTNHSVEGLVVGWDQVNFYGHGAEGLSAFVDGLMLGFNLKAKTPVRCTIHHPGCNAYIY
jgi:hypothetical protein